LVNRSVARRECAGVAAHAADAAESVVFHLAEPVAVIEGLWTTDQRHGTEVRHVKRNQRMFD